MTTAPFRSAPSAPAYGAMAYRGARPAVSLAAATVPVAPPSQEMVAAVAQLGDVFEEREDGLVTRRFSREALARGLASLVLTCEADRERALDIQVVWDEAEGAIAAVVDLAPLRAVRESADAVNRYAAARMRRLAGTGDAQARAA